MRQLYGSALAFSNIAPAPIRRARALALSLAPPIVMSITLAGSTSPTLIKHGLAAEKSQIRPQWRPHPEGAGDRGHRHPGSAKALPRRPQKASHDADAD